MITVTYQLPNYRQITDTVNQNKLFNFCIMEMRSALPRDVLNIVYRYLHDHNYKILQKQYKYIWLSGNPIQQKRIYWCDTHVCFKMLKGYDMLYIANYRWKKITDTAIFNFYDTTGDDVGQLPPNYI